MEQAPLVRQRTWLGHPVGLYVLFLTQMWERFSYFGMLALLILYLNNYFKLQQNHASSIFKWYTSLIYFTPLLGGYLADRWLGNRRAVVLGAVFMAAGHFLMVFPTLQALYAALVLLVVGCGLLTPPLTSQVGLLYPPHDTRRDAAYTIFYMGINLGAFASPLLCGWLMENTRGGFHSGFTVAGIGMVISLVTYVVGLRWIVELDQSAQAAGGDQAAGDKPSPSEKTSVPVEREVEIIPSALPRVNRAAPGLLAGTGIILAVAGPALALAGLIPWDSVVSMELAAVCALMFAWVTSAVKNGLRDRVLAILLLAVFSVFYWAGAGQYGNAINLWAEQNTNRYLTIAPPSASVPEAAAEPAAELVANAPLELTSWQRWTEMFQLVPKPHAPPATTWGAWWSGLVNPVPTAWFQAINPLVILLLSPLFAVIWVRLERSGRSPSIPLKMALGLLLITLAYGLMLLAGASEAQTSSVPFDGQDLPPALKVNEQGQLCRQGDAKELIPYAAGRLFVDQSAGQLRVVGVLSPLVHEAILRDAAPDSTPQWQAALAALAEQANRHRVSPLWLVGFFLLATMGELCLSPVGLSMVSQLAPARFATMLMGMWLLTFAFGNFLAGAWGEKWGTWAPVPFFLVLAIILAGVCLTLLLSAVKVKSLMHGDF